MTEQEIKELVEKIVRLEREADMCSVNDDFVGSSARQHEAAKLEMQLELAGYMLGEDGADMLVYRRDEFLIVRSTWLIFNRAKREWRNAA